MTYPNLNYKQMDYTEPPIPNLSLIFCTFAFMFDVTLIKDTTENGLRRTTFQTCALVCSELIDIETAGNTIRSVRFTAGCNGNLQGIGALVAGMKISEAITRLEGIQCNGRGTSCPDQLARALKQLTA